MTITRLMPAALAFVVGACVLAGCGRGSGDRAAGATAAAGTASSRSRSSCPSTAEVGKVAGFAVQVVMDSTVGSTVICGYQATSPGGEGTFVSLTVEPGDQAGKRIEDVKSGAKVLLAKDADRIDVGERGYAYSASSKSEAVAVANGRVYYAAIESTAQANLGDRKAATVELLRTLMR